MKSFGSRKRSRHLTIPATVTLAAPEAPVSSRSLLSAFSTDEDEDEDEGQNNLKHTFTPPSSPPSPSPLTPSSSSSTSSSSLLLPKTYNDTYSKQYDRKRIEKELREFYKFTHDPKIHSDLNVIYDSASFTATSSYNRSSNSNINSNINSKRKNNLYRPSLGTITNTTDMYSSQSRIISRNNKFRKKNTTNPDVTNPLTRHDEDLFYGSNDEFDRTFHQQIVLDDDDDYDMTDNQEFHDMDEYSLNRHRTNVNANAAATVAAVVKDIHHPTYDASSSSSSSSGVERYYDVDEFSLLQPPIQEVNPHQVSQTNEFENKNDVVLRQPQSQQQPLYHTNNDVKAYENYYTRPRFMDYDTSSNKINIPKTPLKTPNSNENSFNLTDDNDDNDIPELQPLMISTVSMDWVTSQLSLTRNPKNQQHAAEESQISYDDHTVTPSVLFFLNANKNELRNEGLSVTGIETECQSSASASPQSQSRHRTNIRSLLKHHRQGQGSVRSGGASGKRIGGGIGRRQSINQSSSTRLSGSYDTDADETDTTRGKSRSSSRFTTDSPKILELREKKRMIERSNETLVHSFPTIIELDKVEIVTVGSILPEDEIHDDDDDDSQYGSMGRVVI